jgi:hypothetical protein
VNATPGVPPHGRKKIKVTQHCELTILIDIINRYSLFSVIQGIIKMGVSKATCQWCEEWLNLLTVKVPGNLKIVHRASHGKQPDGWKLPSTPYQALETEMKASIMHKVDQVLWLVAARHRRSDSAELPRLDPVSSSALDLVFDEAFFP